MKVQTVTCPLCANRTVCLLSSDAKVASFRVRQAEFNEREVVYSVGLPAENVFVVRSGSLSLNLSDADGNARIVRFVCPGEIVGLDSFLPGNTRIFTAIARDRSILCVFAKADFEQLIKQDCERLWALFLRLDAEAFNAQIEKLQISGERVSKRLEYILLKIRSQSPSKRIRQWELAHFLGVSEETISRQLRIVNALKRGKAS
jgi:CRP-like cAMP-binding protein